MTTVAVIAAATAAAAAAPTVMTSLDVLAQHSMPLSREARLEVVGQPSPWLNTPLECELADAVVTLAMRANLLARTAQRTWPVIARSAARVMLLMQLQA